MTTITDIFNLAIPNMSVESLIMFFIIIFLTYIIRSIFVYILDKKLILLAEKTKTEFDDLVLKASKGPLGYLILLHGFYLAIISLQLPDEIGVLNVAGIIHNAYVMILSFILLYFVFKLIDVLGHLIYSITEKTESNLDDQIAPLVVKS